MPERKGHFAPQNTFLDTISKRFDGTHSNFLLGSAQTTGAYPIVYCSDGFCELTGFHRSQLMQRLCSCPFLYGKRTTLHDREQIKAALEEKKEFKGKMILYKKNREAFNCLVDIVPIKNDKKEVVMFLISHKSILMPEKDESWAGSLNSLPCSDSSSDESRNSSDSPNRPTFQQLGHRRRSRAVLYTLSENLEAKKRKVGCLSSFYNRMMVRRSSSLPQYKVGDKKISKLTILHFGSAKTLWDWLVILVTIYVISSVPFNAALQTVNTELINSTLPKYDKSTHENKAALALDILVEFVFFVDILLTFRTTFVNKSGCVVSDSRQIILHYFKTWFFIDLIAAIPVDTLSHIFDLGYIAQPLAMLKTVRLLRLARLYYSIERWTQYSPVLLLILMLMFGVVAHWLACLWFTIGWSEAQTQSFARVGWLYELSEAINTPFYENGTGGPDVDSSYITALYFTLSSLTSVGFGNVSANTNTEKIFSICVMLIGALMHAAVFGNVTAIIQRMYANKSQYDIKVRDLKEFIKVHRLSRETKARMVDYFQNTWKANGGVDAKKVLKDFPTDIQIDVAMQLYKEVLSIQTFQKGPKGFSRLISLCTHRRKVAPGEYVIHSGDPLLSVIFVCKGSLEVIKNGEFVGILGKGDLFGADVGSPYDQSTISKADVKSTFPCELECICIKGIKKAMDVYPQFANPFIRDMRADYSFNLWETPFDSHSIDLKVEENENDFSSWRVSSINRSRRNNRNSTFHSNDFDMLEDRRYGDDATPSDSDFSSNQDAESYDLDSCEPQQHSPSTNAFFDVQINEDEPAKVDRSTTRDRAMNRDYERTAYKSNVTTNNTSASTKNCVGSTRTTPCCSPVKTNALTVGNTERPKKLTQLMSSLTSVFSGKPSSHSKVNLEDNCACAEKMEGGLRPSCFKKSLLSLDRLSYNQSRSESPASDVSSTTKRVTFCEDSSCQKFKRKSERSHSIPSEKSRNTEGLPKDFSNSMRRHHSDVGLPSSALTANKKAYSFTNLSKHPEFCDHIQYVPEAGLRKSKLQHNCLPNNSTPSARKTRRSSSHSNLCYTETSVSSVKQNNASYLKGNSSRRNYCKTTTLPSFTVGDYRQKGSLTDGCTDLGSKNTRDNKVENLGQEQDKEEERNVGQKSICDCYSGSPISDFKYIMQLQQINLKLHSLHCEIQSLVEEWQAFKSPKHPISVSCSDSALCKASIGPLHQPSTHLENLQDPVEKESDDPSLLQQFESRRSGLSNIADDELAEEGGSGALPVCVVTSPAGNNDVLFDCDRVVPASVSNRKIGLSESESLTNEAVLKRVKPENTNKRVDESIFTKSSSGAVANDARKSKNLIQTSISSESISTKDHFCQVERQNATPLLDLHCFPSSSIENKPSEFASSRHCKQGLQDHNRMSKEGHQKDFSCQSNGVFMPNGSIMDNLFPSDYENKHKNYSVLTQLNSSKRTSETEYNSASPTV